MPASPWLWLVASLVALAVPARAQITYTPWIPIFKGIDRASGTNASGYAGGPLVVQALRMDLHDPDVKIFTTPRNTNNYAVNSRETFSRTPGSFLKENQLRVAMNCAHYGGSTAYSTPDGANTWIHGYAISQGVFVSPVDTGGDNDCLMYLTTNKVPYFQPYTTSPLVATNDIYTAIPGMYSLVVDGANVGWSYLGQGGVHGQQPRSALGFSQDGRYFILLAIDGRQSDSQGAVDYETADWLILFGAYQGMNVDGGGSTCMVMANDCGDSVTLNDPSIRYATGGTTLQRSVGHNIGFYAKSLPTVFMQNALATPGRSMAVLTWDTAAPATSQVEYGSTATLGIFSALDSTLRTNHAVVLTGLSLGATNYFRMISRANNVTYSTPICFFKTLTNGAPVVASGAEVNPVFPITQGWKYNTNRMDNTPSWKSTSYDDSAWEGPGPGLLYVEDSTYVYPRNTPLPSPRGPGVPSASPQIPITYYFRTLFEFPTNPANVSLVFSNLIDDGAVFYLNGAEVYRLRMAAAPAVITSTTLATGFPAGPPNYTQGVDPQYGDAAAEAPAVFTLSGAVVTNNLIQGDNVMAVEVHNYSAGSPDIVFGTAVFYSKNVLVTNSLVVISADPALPVLVTLATNDNYGQWGGVTPMERFYYPNASVTLTATNAIGEKVFKEWRMGGSVFSTEPTITVSMGSNRLLEVVYADPLPVQTWTLQVNSANPAAEVFISVDPSDVSTNSSGSTPFSRVFTNDTTVNLVAPEQVGVNHFLTWLLDGTIHTTNRAMDVSMTTNHVLTAVYSTPNWILNLVSVNPDHGVDLVVSPPDSNGQANGSTPTNRAYLHGALVTVTAPAAVGVNYFQAWQLDGQVMGTNLSVQVLMETNHILAAVYEKPRWILALESVNPNTNVLITVTPPDANGLGDGTTPTNRWYGHGTTVTVTAPAMAGVNSFQTWQLNGQAVDTNLSVEVLMETNHTLTAVYQTPQWILAVSSVNPETNVLVSVSPADVNADGDGVTPLLRRYWHGSWVTLTAPATVGENTFHKWLLDGQEHSTNQMLELLLETNRNLTLVYQSPVVVEPPKLGVEAQSGMLVLNWTNIGYVLETTTNLTLSVWTNVPGPITNGPFTNAIGGREQYFRLRQENR